MKSTAAYYLLLLYITVMVHPLIPIISDSWSHAFSEINHLATVHAKYGTHHLEIALSKTEGDTDKNKSTNKIDNYSAVHTLVETVKNSQFYISEISFPLLIQTNLSSIFLLKHTPPPKNYC